MKYQPGTILRDSYGDKHIIVGYTRYSKNWYYVTLDEKGGEHDIYQGEVELEQYYTKTGEAA